MQSILIYKSIKSLKISKNENIKTQQETKKELSKKAVTTSF